MKLPRRKFLHLAAATAGMSVAPHVTRAQAYSNRPVRIVIGFPPGGVSDILARLVGQRLSERLGQPFIVETRPGAASNLAAETVVRSPADGHTLLFVSTTNTINATLYDKLNFDLLRDISPVASIYRVPSVMVVNLSVPTKTVSEFVAYAKADPNRINMASGGNGSMPHVAGELFKTMTGVKMLHVPYRGETPAITDLLGGQVQVFFGSATSLIEHIRTGKLRALAVTTSTHSEALPDIPTMAEYVPGYEASGWQGLGAPANTPAEIIGVLNREISAALGDVKLKAKLVELGGAPMPMTPSEFGKHIGAETEKWGKVIRAANIKPD
jgi:tripartite-type tricarboxylate transporter receptor subunit TctC